MRYPLPAFLFALSLSFPQTIAFAQSPHSTPGASGPPAAEAGSTDGKEPVGGEGPVSGEGPADGRQDREEPGSAGEIVGDGKTGGVGEVSGLGKAAAGMVRRGEVEYRPPRGDERVADRFRLAAHRFSYEETLLPRVSDYLTIANVTFPSPVKTEVESNNTVHCEYYRPRGEGRVPAVVVLHILGGDFELSRLFCNALAHRGVAALFLKMPYYGPRRDPESPRRMISSDPRETVEGMTQAVLDVRRAVAWLAAREEVDAERLGIFGISLGGITAALTTTAEPRIDKACLLLAGGDLGQVAQQSSRLARLRKAWQARGGDPDEYLKLLEVVDPVRYAANARDRRILMINAKSDEVIPRASTEALWKALGQPEIVWYSGGHYTVGWHVLNALERVTGFFQPRPEQVP